MSDEPTFEQLAHTLTDYLNNEIPLTVLKVGRTHGDIPDAQSARVAAIDAAGFALDILDGQGQARLVRVEFPQPATEPGETRSLLMSIIDEADEADGIERVATARVETPRASRYLRALCNHFDRKVQAEYDDNEGRIHFPFGECELHATDEALEIRVTAVSEVRLARARRVVADHLVRFAQKETLHVDWVTVETPAPVAE